MRYTKKEEQSLWEILSSMQRKNFELFIEITKVNGLPEECIEERGLDIIKSYKWLKRIC